MGRKGEHLCMRNSIIWPPRSIILAQKWSPNIVSKCKKYSGMHFSRPPLLFLAYTHTATSTRTTWNLMTTVLQLESSCCRDIVRLCTAVITERRTSVSSLNTPHPHQPSCRHACVHHPTMCIFLICYSQTTEECKSLWDRYSLLLTPPSNHWGKRKCTPHTS